MTNLILKVEAFICDKKCSKTLNIKLNSSWDETKRRISDELGAVSKGVMIQYLDDEDDWITVTNDSEWQEAIKVSSYQNYCNHPTVNLKVIVSELLAKATSCCSEFKRPIPPDPTTNIVPMKIVNPTANQYKYTGEALRAVTLPLGPIGGGCIAIAGDGGLRQWQVSNRICHLAHVPDSFFAIRVDDGTTSKAVVLQSPSLYDDTGFVPAAYITDHVVPEASKKLLSQLPGVKTVEVTAKYPVVEVDYTSGEVPVNVHMEAFNPCIPLDSKNSGLPVIIFNFTVTNSSSNTATVALLGSLQNFVGWDGASDITNEVYNNGYRGNMNTKIQTKEYIAIDMSNPTLDVKHPYNGHVTLAGLGGNSLSTSYMLQYNSVGTMWQYFTTSGLPGQGQTGPSPNGMTWNGAVSLKGDIPAGGKQIFTFILGWHFPNKYVNWDQRGFGIKDEITQFYLGNMYYTYWSTIEDVLEYTVSNLQELSTNTYTFRDAMFDSSLPWQLVDSAAGRVSVIRSPSAMWLADGNFYCFEGCSAQTGCCPLNCTHVLNYEMCLSRMYPDLERTMRSVDLQQQISPNAIIPSRTTLPLELRRQWSFWPDYTIVNPASTSICVDGEIGTVLKTYREVRQGAPADWFNNMWPQVQKIMTRWMTEMDDGTGTVKGPQPNTYDVAMYGVNTFIGSLYLCALRAAEEMAKLQGDQDSANKYSDRFKLGTQNLDKACYTNGKWYTQVVDPNHNVQVVSDGTFVDCLGGQWWAHSLNLGYILPGDHVKSTVSSVFTGNHVDSFNPVDQYPRKFFDQRDAGLYICRWPDGKVPSNALRYTSEGAWTGLEYPFAGLALYEGLYSIALQVLVDARNKYDGTRRSPWNEVECGDHYTRPMAGFLFFEIASGQQWNVQEKSIQFAPRLNFTNFKGFFITGTAWGQYIQNGNASAELVVSWGKLQLKQLIIQTTGTSAALKIDSTVISGTSFAQSNGMLITTFASVIEVDAGSNLTKDKKHYMKYLSAGPLPDIHRGSSQPGSVSKSNFEGWKMERNNEQMIKKLESTMKTILNNTNELTKSVCTLQASFNKTNEHQTNELQSLSTQVNLGFNTVQEKFKELKSEDNDNMLLLNKLLDEISKLKKDIAKRDKQLEEMHKEIVELKSGKILAESIKKTFQVVLKEFFTTETLKLLGNQRPATPHTETSRCYDNDSDGEQVSEVHDHQGRETVPLSRQEQVPVVPDISSHQQIPAYGGQISNSSFNSPASEWASDFSKSSGQKRTYSQRITISRKISPAISPMVSTGQREYGTWGGDTSSSDHDTIEVTQLASFTRKVRRKPKATNLSEEQNQNAAICGSWQQNSYKKDQNSHSTQAVLPVGRFKRSIEARKRRILCDSNDAELLQISASIRQQQMNRQLKL